MPSILKALVTAAPALLTLAMLGSPAQAAGTSGPDSCASGYVWREAIPSDHVCVTPQVRQQAAYDNSKAASRRNPNGPSVSNSCVGGYVWREAFQGDAVCVVPAVRQQARDDNAQAANRVAH